MARLIDAEALKAELTGKIALPDWVLTAVLHIIDNAPTVEITKEQDRPTGGQVLPDTLQGWRYVERPIGGEQVYPEQEADDE